jgi:hypothetical protein
VRRIAVIQQKQLKSSHRLDVQDRARRLKREPQAEEQEKLEKMRQLLNNQFGILDSLRQRIEGAMGCLNTFPDIYEDAAFDDIDNDTSIEAKGKNAATEQCNANTNADADADADAATAASNAYLAPAEGNSDWDGICPEYRVLPIPSAMDNPLDQHRNIEMRLRQRQADTLLISLRELIADKSFHYSHVLRLTSGQSMRSRARSKIAALNAELSICCRTYTRCRAVMIRLRVPEDIMKGYLSLTKSDIKVSTALVDPNKPGSSTLRLSWIWQTQTCGQDAGTNKLLECKDITLK